MADGIDEGVVAHDASPKAVGSGENAVVTRNMPPEVELKPSQVDQSRLGAWCKHSIPIGCRFGPFVGEKVKMLPTNVDTQYVWEILDKKGSTVLYYLDASCAANANWMRHVNCARYYEEQNLVSVQEGEQIFYKVIKDINPNEELLTWYDKTDMKGASSSAEKPQSGENHPSVDDAGQTSDINIIDSDDTIVDHPPPNNKPELPKSRKRRKKVKRLTLKNKRKRQIEKYNDDSNTTDKYSDEKDNRSVKKRVRKKRGKLLRLKKLNIKSKKVVKDIDQGEPLHDSRSNKRLTRLQITAKKKKGKIEIEPKQQKDKALNMISRDKTAQQNDSGFYSFQLLRQHIVRDRKGKPAYKCNICHLVYSYIHSLKRHFIRNHINYKYVSENDRIQCNLNVELLKSMGRALETGTSVKKNTPSQKDTTKVNSDTTKISSKTKHNAVEESASKPRRNSLPDLYWCNMCNKLFHTLDKLKIHSVVHPSMTLHPCHKCGLKFQRQKNLFKHHLAVHTGEAEEMEGTSLSNSNTKNTSVSNASTPRTGTPTISRTSTPTNQTMKNGATKSGNLKSGKRYNATSALLDNMDVYGEDEADSFNCYNCGRSFPNHSLMNKHVIKGKCKNASYTSSGSHGSKSGFMFACTVCKTRFHSYAMMCRHRRNEHQVASNVVSDVDVLDSDSNSAAPSSISNDHLYIDQNTAYFASIPRGVAENVRYYIDGNQGALNQSDTWFREDVISSDNQSVALSNTNWRNFNLLNEFTPDQMYDAVTKMQLSTVESWAPKPSDFTGHEYNTLADTAQFTCAVCGWVFQVKDEFYLHMEVQHGLVGEAWCIDQVQSDIESIDTANANHDSEIVKSELAENSNHESEMELSIQSVTEEKNDKTEKMLEKQDIKKATTRSRSLDKIERREMSPETTRTLRSRSLEKPELMSRHKSETETEISVLKSEEKRSRSKEKSSPSKEMGEKSQAKIETRPESVDKSSLKTELQDMPRTRSQSIQKNKHRASSVEKSTRERSLEKEYAGNRRSLKLVKSKSSENLTNVLSPVDQELNSRSLGGTPTKELANDKSKRLTRAMKRLREDIVATKDLQDIPKTRSAARRMYSLTEKNKSEVKEEVATAVKQPEKTNECDGEQCDEVCRGTSVSKFVCLVCKKDFYDLTCIKTHNWLVHPRLHCTFMELDKHQWDVPFYQPTAPRHGGDIGTANLDTESEISFKPPKQKFVCTKCEQVSESIDHFHVHILQCAGDNTTIAAPIPQEYEAVGKTKGKRHGSAKKIKRQEYKRGKYKLNRLDADDDEEEPLLEAVTPPKATKTSTRNKQLNDENKENKGATQGADKKQEWVAADMPICWVCGKIFAGKKQFRRHKMQAKRCFETRKKSKMQNHNPVKTKKGGAILYQCGFCQREFAYEGYFLNHIKVFCTKRKELLANSKRHAEEFRKMNENASKLESKKLKEASSPIQRKPKPKNRNHKWSSWYRKKQARDVKEKELEKEKQLNAAKEQETVKNVEVSPSNSDDISLAALARKTRRKRMDNISKIRENLMRQSKRLSGLAAKRLRDKSYDDIIKMVSEGSHEQPSKIKPTETNAPKTRARVRSHSPGKAHDLMEDLPAKISKEKLTDIANQIDKSEDLIKRNVIAQNVLRRAKRRRRTALTLEGHRRKKERMKKADVSERSGIIADTIEEVASGKIKINPTAQYMEKLVNENEQTSKYKSDDRLNEEKQTKKDIPQDQAKIPLKSKPNKQKSKMKANLVKKKIGKMKKSLKTKKITHMFQSRKSQRERKQIKVPEESIPTLIPDGMHKLRPRRKLHTPDKPPILQPALDEIKHDPSIKELPEVTKISNELTEQKSKEKIEENELVVVTPQVESIEPIKPILDSQIKDISKTSKEPSPAAESNDEITSPITKSEKESVEEDIPVTVTRDKHDALRTSEIHSTTTQIDQDTKHLKQSPVKDQVLVPEMKLSEPIGKCLPNPGNIHDPELRKLTKHSEKNPGTQVTISSPIIPKKDVWTISIKTKPKSNRRPKSTTKTKTDSGEEKLNKDSKADERANDVTKTSPEINCNQDEGKDKAENNSQSSDKKPISDFYPDTLIPKKKSAPIRLARRRAVDSITAGLIGESLDDDIDAPLVVLPKRKTRNIGPKATKSGETKMNKIHKVTEAEGNNTHDHDPLTKPDNKVLNKDVTEEGKEHIKEEGIKPDSLNKMKTSSNKFQKLNADILKDKKQRDHSKFSKLTELHIDVHQSGDHNDLHANIAKPSDKIRSPVISPSKRYITINSTEKISPEETEPGPKYMYTKKTTKITEPSNSDLFEDSDPYSFSETEGRGRSPIGKYRHVEHLKMSDRERKNMANVIKASLSRFDKSRSHKTIECTADKNTEDTTRELHPKTPSNEKEVPNRDVKQPPLNEPQQGHTLVKEPQVSPSAAKNEQSPKKEHKLTHKKEISIVTSNDADTHKQAPIKEQSVPHTTAINIVTDTDTKTNTSSGSSPTQLSPIVLYHKEMLQKRIRHDLKRHSMRRQNVQQSVSNVSESSWREPCSKLPSPNSGEKQARLHSSPPLVSAPRRQVLNYETGQLEDETPKADSPTTILNEKTGFLNVETSSSPTPTVPSKTVTKPAEVVVQPSDLVYMYQGPKVSPRECSISASGRVRTKAERKQMHWLLQNQDNAQLKQIPDEHINQIPPVVALRVASDDDANIGPTNDDTITTDDTRRKKQKRKHKSLDKATHVAKHPKMEDTHPVSSETPATENDIENNIALEPSGVSMVEERKDENNKKTEEPLVSPALSVDNNWESTHLQMLTRHEIMWLNNQLDTKEKPKHNEKKTDGAHTKRKKSTAKIEKNIVLPKKTKQKQKITKMFKQKKPRTRDVQDKNEKSTKTFDIIEENINRLNAAKKDDASNPINATTESGGEACNQNKEHVKEKRKSKVFYTYSDDETPAYRNIFEITTVEGKRRSSKPNTDIAEDNKLARRLERNMWKMINDTDSDGDRKSKKRVKRITKNKRIVNKSHVTSSSDSHKVDDIHAKCTCTCEDSSVVLENTDKDMDSVSVSSGETIINTDVVHTSL